jgi:hypothetical protein
VRVQGDALRAASAQLDDRARVARDLLTACARVPAGLHDPALREAVRALSDLVGDVLEVLAADLDLLATKVRAGVVVYDEVEASVLRRAAR